MKTQVTQDHSADDVDHSPTPNDSYTSEHELPLPDTHSGAVQRGSRRGHKNVSTSGRQSEQN